MKKLFTFSIMIILLFSANLTSLAADGETSDINKPSEVETIPIGEDATISYATTVIDLNTGTEYHAKTNESAIIEAELGHQYSVSAVATVTENTGNIEATTHFSIGNNGLVINYHFAKGGGAHMQTYSFKMPENTKLVYVKKSIFSNSNDTRWEAASGNKGLITYMYEDVSVNDGFILEVVDQSTTNKKTPVFLQPACILAFFIGLLLSCVGLYLHNRRR